MACGTCGGKKTVTVGRVSSSSQNMQPSGQMVVMQYVGKQIQRRRLKSKAQLGHSYTFSADESTFYAYTEDVDWLLSMKDEFQIAKIQADSIPINVEQAPVLKSEMPPVRIELPIDVLALDNITMSHLKKVFNTVSEVKAANDSDLLAIKGFGPKRVQLVREAISEI